MQNASIVEVAEKKKYDGELTTEEIKNAFKQIANDMDASKILIM